MAILNREDFMAAVHGRIGTASDDESIAFVENMTDTFNEMERRANDNSSGDWERKYHELDESWRKRYTHRFLTGSDCMNPVSEQEEKEQNRAETITIDDLFGKEEK